MIAQRRRPKKSLAKQNGATLVEYAIMLLLIAMIAFASVTFFGQMVASSLQNSADQMPKH